jgi:two-component system response regulator AtoC
MITSVETALVVDDDALMRDFVVETLSRRGLAITQAENGREAKRLMEEKEFDIAFIDLKMPGIDGMQLLRIMKEGGIATLPVIVTAFGTVERAVEAMKVGAYDFLMKPFSPEQVELVLDRANDWIKMRSQNAYLQEELGLQLPRGRQMIGRSASMQALLAQIERVAQSSATVLATGESGTGKELVALAIHSLSERRDGPFVRMSCAAVPDTLMDSELFGHEKGSFTSAVARRLGRFELADGGTLLLDEIGEIKLELQAKLLRVLQEREFERVGGTRPVQTDCRVIATTNRNLGELVRRGEFREDLYYRLNVLPIHVPPLRERAADIPLLAMAFLARRDGKRMLRGDGFTAAAMERMCAYAWPGNIRELQNVVERMNVLAADGALGVEALPPEIRGASDPALSAAAPQSPRFPSGPPAPVRAAGPVTLRLADIERETILRALQSAGGSRQRTADLLDISVRTLRNKLNEYRAGGLLDEFAAQADGTRAA